MSVNWPSGVPDKFARGGYSRALEDVVRRRAGDTGPPIRRLRWATAGQTLKGVIPMSRAQADTLEDWRLNTLDHGQASFSLVLRDHPSPRTVTAQMTAQPRLVSAGPVMRRIAFDLRLAAPVPVQAAIAALAALDRAAPASWPSGVPSTPRRSGFSSEPDTRVLRGDPAGPMTGRVMARQEGRAEPVTLAMTSAQLESFEAWFATTAAYGARDVLFPSGGSVLLGCFAGAYTVAASTELATFDVAFDRYIEAVQ